MGQSSQWSTLLEYVKIGFGSIQFLSINTITCSQVNTLLYSNTFTEEHPGDCLWDTEQQHLLIQQIPILKINLWLCRSYFTECYLMNFALLKTTEVMIHSLWWYEKLSGQDPYLLTKDCWDISILTFITLLILILFFLIRHSEFRTPRNGFPMQGVEIFLQSTTVMSWKIVFCLTLKLKHT